MTNYTVIITSYKEPDLVSECIESVILSNKSIINQMQLLVVCGDQTTYNCANTTLTKNQNNFSNYTVLKDNAKGKSQALNLAFKKAKGNIWIMTDGDVYLEKDAVTNLIKPFQDKKTIATTGQIKSLEKKDNFFGYYSHVFTDAANFYRHNKQQTNNAFFPLSGYLYAIYKQNNLVLPKGLKAEDDYISHLIYKPEYNFKYVSTAIVNVRFPKNLNDLIRQKVRSLGGNVQNKKFFPTNNRSIFQDLKMFLFPITYANNLKQFVFSLLIYPLRLYLWFVIYYQHMTNNYKDGAWDIIESSKR